MEYLKLIEITGGLVARLLGLNKDRKLEVAKYLTQIAETLSEFPVRVRAGAKFEELGGLSKQAGEYAARFGDATEVVLSEKDILRFKELLGQAHDAKRASPCGARRTPSPDFRGCAQS